MGKEIKRAIYFGAGPGKLPLEILEEVQDKLICYNNTGVSILEVSHRSRQFKDILENAQARLTEILKIPSNYKVMFLQGGATGVFSAVLLNMMKNGTADYIVTGSWSSKAAKEATKFGRVNLVLPKTKEYTEIPDASAWKLDANASYVYYCDNETMQGIEFCDVPDTKGVPLVADMSSNFASKSIDISKYALIFAGAHKNVGPSGVTIVIVKKDFIGSAMSICPYVLDFSVIAAKNSIHNTPPIFQIYFIGLVFDWIKKNGGVKSMEKLSQRKSQLIYDVVDESDGFYINLIRKSCRSRMNITFKLKNEHLENEFIAGAAAENMLELKGHRSVGGLRASLYIAITFEETTVLAEYMKSFHQKHMN